MPINIFDILFPVFDMVFDFWPIFLITPLVYRKSGIKNLVYLWGFWAVIRIFLFFNPEPIKSILIPEPSSTYWFFITGFVLVVIWIGIKLIKHKQNA